MIYSQRCKFSTVIFVLFINTHTLRISTYIFRNGCYNCHNIKCDKDLYSEALRNYKIDLVKNSTLSKKKINSLVLEYYKDLQKKDKLTSIKVSLEDSCVNCKNWMTEKINKLEDRLVYHKMFNTKICGSELREIGDINPKELAAYRKWRKDCKLGGKRIVTPLKKKSINNKK